MLTQWSRQIYEAWLGIYAKTLPILAQRNNGKKKQKLIEDAVSLVDRLSQRSEPLPVRSANPMLIGAMADANSLLSVDTFRTRVLIVVKRICQDFNWEVRKEICG